MLTVYLFALRPNWAALWFPYTTKRLNLKNAFTCVVALGIFAARYEFPNVKFLSSYDSCLRER